MKRSNRSKKFSLSYRIEKWFYEDSLKHFLLFFKTIGFLILGLFGLASICILPALFH